MSTPDESSPAPIRVFVVDDHEMVRRGLAAFLSAVDDFEWAGEAAGGEPALAAINTLAHEGRLPDVALIDLMMPGLDGVATVRRLAAAHPTVRSVVLTGFSDAARIDAVVASGAAGFLLKDASPSEVETAIRAAIRDEFYLDSAMTRRLAGLTPLPAELSTLSPRELEVLGLLGRGLSNIDLAQRLGISERTARTHVSNILAKLHVPSRTQAALLASHAGLSD